MNVYPADSNGGITAGEMAEAKAVIGHLPPKAAKIAAIEILLADPESLGDDVLESALYILREKLHVAHED